MNATVRIQAESFDAAIETSLLTKGRRDIGAVVTFTGFVRDEGGTLAALELEHYAGMAEEEIGRVVADAIARWPLQGVTIIHRYGRLEPGAPVVLVVAAAAHRAAAFASADFLMDYLKTRAPFWKKEHLRDGSTGGWVAAKAADDAAAERWSRV